MSLRRAMVKLLRRLPPLRGSRNPQEKPSYVRRQPRVQCQVQCCVRKELARWLCRAGSEPRHLHRIRREGDSARRHNRGRFPNGNCHVRPGEPPQGQLLPTVWQAQLRRPACQQPDRYRKVECPDDRPTTSQQKHTPPSAPALFAAATSSSYSKTCTDRRTRGHCGKVTAQLNRQIPR